jgi:hypothetical protein
MSIGDPVRDDGLGLSAGYRLGGEIAEDLRVDTRVTA